MGDTDKQATWHNLSGCKTGKISFSTIYSADEEPEIKSKTDAKEDDDSSSKKDGEQDNKDNAPMKEQDQATPIADSDNKKVGETVQQEKEEIEEETGDTAPDSFINDIYTSEGKQSVPEQESEVSKETVTEDKQDSVDEKTTFESEKVPEKEENEKPRTGALGLKDAMKQVETSPLAENKPDDSIKKTKIQEVEKLSSIEKTLPTLDQDS